MCPPAPTTTVSPVAVAAVCAAVAAPVIAAALTLAVSLIQAAVTVAVILAVGWVIKEPVADLVSHLITNREVRLIRRERAQSAPLAIAATPVHVITTARAALPAAPLAIEAAPAVTGQILVNGKPRELVRR